MEQPFGRSSHKWYYGIPSGPKGCLSLAVRTHEAFDYVGFGSVRVDRKTLVHQIKQDDLVHIFSSWRLQSIELPGKTSDGKILRQWQHLHALWGKSGREVST